MNARSIKMLFEKFGDPIGSYAGEPAAGVRDEDESMVETCPACNMLPVDGNCGCEENCDGCGIPVSQCDCEETSKVCPACGMMSTTVNTPCSCGISEGSSTCSECGMNEATCECGMNLAK